VISFEDHILDAMLLSPNIIFLDWPILTLLTR